MAMTGNEATTEAPPLRPGVVTNARGTGIVPGSGNNSMRWFFSAIWLVYLIAPVSALFGHGHGVWWIAGGLAITIAFCLLYVGILGKSTARTPPARARAGLVAIAVLAALACV